MEEVQSALETLARQMESLDRRLGALEGSPSEPVPVPVQEVVEEREGGPLIRGNFTYAGLLQVGSHRSTVRSREDIAEAFEVDADALARVFAALASPVRIQLLRRVLEGPRTSQELQLLPGVGGVGQLYHHLKELLAAGLLIQRKRSLYEIRAEKAMLLCLLLAAAPRLIPDGQGLSPGRPDEEESQ